MQSAMTDYLKEIASHADALGLTPAQLCVAAGMAKSTWYRWLKGAVAPNTGSIRKLLAYRPPATRRKRGSAA